MSADEFWKDDPQLFVSYRTFFINKKQREMEEADYKCWLQGLYVHNGNGLLFASLKQFISNLVAGLFKGSKDNKKIDTYPSKPYFELQKEEQKKKEKTLHETKYQNYHDSLIYYGTMKQQYINKILNEKKGE